MTGDPLSSSAQVLVVTTPGWDAVQGKLQRYQRDSPAGRWHSVGAPIDVVVGKSGMGWGAGAAVVSTDPSDPVKKEGDGRSPAGVFPLGTAFGAASQPPTGLRLPYFVLTPSVECVDDVRSRYYNRLVDRSAVAADWNSSEHMLAVGEPYRWGIVVGQNAASTVPNAGSCVFLHIWGGPTHGTAGCTAMSSPALEELLIWLDPSQKPFLVQLPTEQYARLRTRWRLPAFP